MATILIGGVIAAYAGWVLYRKYKQWKAGQYCSCGCGGCSSKSKCKDWNK